MVQDTSAFNEIQMPYIVDDTLYLTGNVTGEPLTAYVNRVWPIAALSDTASITGENQGDVAFVTGGTAVAFRGSAYWNPFSGGGGGGTFNSFNIAGDTGSDIVTDGQTVTVAGGYGINTAETGGTVTATADTTQLATQSDISGFGTMSSFTVAGGSGTPQTITDGNTLTLSEGYGINTLAAATDDVRTEVDTTQIATQFDISGLPSGSGTNQRIVVWTGTNSQGNSTQLQSAAGVTLDANLAYRITGGTTASRPTGAAGMQYYNTSNNWFDLFNGTSWFNPARSAYSTGLYTNTRIPFGDANGLLTDASGLTWNGAILNITPSLVPTSNVFVRSGNLTLTGTENSAFGSGAFASATTGSSNVALGSFALALNTSGDNNMAIGYAALLLNTTGASNVAIGANTLRTSVTSSNNVAIGAQAARFTTDGGSNIAIGSNAMRTNTTGSNNVAVGESALYNNLTSANNTAIGKDAGYYASGGTNTLIGFSSGVWVTSGAGNVGIGSGTLSQVVGNALTGSNNVAIGLSTGDNIQGAAAGNVAIGNQVDFPTASGSNQLVVSNLIFGTGAAGTGTTISAGGKVGIKVAAPARDLHVAGEVRITDLTTDTPTRIVGADADGDLGAIAATITTAGTTGNVTINTLAGTVNIAAAGTTVTVTNSLVTANSLVFCTLRTNDTTATVKNCVPAAGSFVINLGAAATGEVSIGFFVVN